MKIKKQRFVIYFCSLFVGITFFVGIIAYFSNLSESILPKEVEFRINHPKILAIVKPKVESAVLAAKKKNTTRTQLLDNILEILSQYDAIDKYSVHLGFDGKLLVFADVQHPVLAVQDNTGRIFVIGSAMKIIGKNPSSSILQNIPNIVLSDTKIKDKHDKSINFAWFLAQSNLINEHLQGKDFKIQKITWAKTIGFTVKLKDTDENNQIPENVSHLIVYLGKENIDLKVKNFKTLGAILKQKNLKAREIDLDLLDRAFIK